MIYTNFNELENKELNEGDKIHFLLIGEKPIKYEILNSQMGVYLNISNSRDFMEIAENEFIFRKLSIIDRYVYVKDIVGYDIKVGNFPEVKDLKDLKKVCLCLYRLIEKYNENNEILYNVTSVNDLKCRLIDKRNIDKKYIYVFYLSYFRDEFKGQLLLLLNDLKIPYTLESLEKEDLKIRVELTDELIIELNILLKKITLY